MHVQIVQSKLHCTYAPLPYWPSKNYKLSANFDIFPIQDIIIKLDDIWMLSSLNELTLY